jgi:hypothetical protein
MGAHRGSRPIKEGFLRLLNFDSQPGTELPNTSARLLRSGFVRLNHSTDSDHADNGELSNSWEQIVAKPNC